MKVLLVLFIDSFKTLKLEINPTTLHFSGSTENYDHTDTKSLNHISFSLSDISKTKKVAEEIRSKFNLNPDMCDVDEYIKVNDHRIGLFFSNGLRGLVNPPSFEIKSV